MIQRNPLNAAVSHSEPLYQASFTAMKGIDSSKAITVPNVVQNMENLDVNTDGSVSIRKPLIFKRAYALDYYESTYVANHVAKLYDNEHSLVVYSNNVDELLSIESDDGTPVQIKFNAERRTDSAPFVFTVEGPSFRYSVSNLISITDLHLVNTSSSSIFGAEINAMDKRLSALLYNPSVMDAEYAKALPRYISISKSDDGTFNLTIKNPEINTLEAGATIVQNPNMLLDNAFATRDVYDSNYVAINGILPYAYCETADTPARVDAVKVPEGTFTDSFSASYNPQGFLWDGALPPYNTLITEFLTLPTSSVTGDYWRYGGKARIWFNKFNVDAAPTVCTLKPYRVSVNVSARSATSGDSFAESDPSVIRYVYKNGTVIDGKTYSKGEYVGNNLGTLDVHNFSFDQSQIKGDSVTGYYVDCDGIPVATQFFGFKTNNTDPETGYRLRTVESSCNEGTDGSTTALYEVWVEDANGNVQGLTKLHLKEIRSGVYSVAGRGLFDIIITTTVTYKPIPAEDTLILSYSDTKYFTATDIMLLSRKVGADTTLGLPYGAFTPFRYSKWGENYHAKMYLGKTAAYHGTLSNASLNTPDATIKDSLFKTKVASLNVESVVQELTSIAETVSTVTTSENLNLTISQGLFEHSAVLTLNTTPVPIKLPPYASITYNMSFSKDGVPFLQNNNVDGITSKNFTTNATLYNASEALSVHVEAKLVLQTFDYAKLYMYSVEEVTERVHYPKFELASNIENVNYATVLLKAFMNLINKYDLEYYGVWEYSTDGVNWTSYYNLSFEDRVNSVFTEIFKPITFEKKTITADKVTGESVTKTDTYGVVGVKINAYSPTDNIFTPCYTDSDGIVKPYTRPLITEDVVDYVLPYRADVIVLQNVDETVASKYCIEPNIPVSCAQFRFTVCTLNPTDSEIARATVKSTLAQMTCVPNVNGHWEFANADLGNAVYGDKLYYNKQIYSFNYAGFKNNVLSSDSNSFITPLLNTIDVNTVADSVVTSLTPWRNYLVASTSDSIHLITPSDGGAFLRTVCTYIGVPSQDRRTCKAILNGIVFKSGSKIYTLYPNTSSGDETILNLSEISHPVSHILESLNSTYDTFAIGTDRSYSVFIPFNTHTYCLKYDYDLKVWTVFRYNGVRFTDYHLTTVDNITLYGIREDGILCEFYYDSELKDVYPNFIEGWEIESFDNVPYGDFLTEESLTPTSTPALDVPKPQPIEFKLDSGQRTDNLSLTKKFSESKFLLATLNSNAAAKINVDVYVDGNPYKIRLKGDGIVYKDAPEQLLTLGENVQSDGSEAYNTVSQVFLRYSGKGKTIRHVITGSSLYNFKLYEVFYRYRIMPNKQ